MTLVQKQVTKIVSLGDTTVPIRGYYLIFGAYIVLLLALSIDLIVMVETPLLAEGIPIFDNLYLLRTALIGGTSSLAVIGIVKLRREEKGDGTLNISGEFPASRTGRVAFLSSQNGFGSSARKWTLWVVLTLSVGFLLLFLSNPVEFHRFGSEDHPVEILSALLLLAASAVFVVVIVKLNKAAGRRVLMLSAISLVFATTFFFIGMEEISWFQRVFGLETPELLKAGARDELNLHNLATDEVEIMYYSAAFLFLITVPFLDDVTRLFQRWELTSFFVPGRGVLMVGAIAMAYNYDMWNILFIQVAFFITLYVLIYYVWRDLRLSRLPLELLMLVAAYGLTQAAFLTLGSRSVRLWDVTEYKEFFIPLAFFFYALEILSRSRNFERVPMERPAR